MTGAMGTTVAALAVAALGYVVAGGRSGRRTRAGHRLLESRPGTGATGDRGRPAGTVSARPVLAGSALLVVVGAVVGGPVGVLATSGCVGPLVLAVRLVRIRRRRRTARADRHRLTVALGVLSAELRAGRVAGEALLTAAEEYPALLAIDVDACPPTSGPARADSRVPAGLRALEVAWRVAGRSGAALGAVVDRLAEAVRADEQVRRQVAAGLAGTRSTARLLALLPVVPLAMAQSLGQHPLDFLLGSAAGLGCLAGGAALAIAGLVWVERLAAGCEEP